MCHYRPNVYRKMWCLSHKVTICFGLLVSCRPGFYGAFLRLLKCCSKNEAEEKTHRGRSFAAWRPLICSYPTLRRAWCVGSAPSRPGPLRWRSWSASDRRRRPPPSCRCSERIMHIDSGVNSLLMHIQYLCGTRGAIFTVHKSRNFYFLWQILRAALCRKYLFTTRKT